MFCTGSSKQGVLARVSSMGARPSSFVGQNVLASLSLSWCVQQNCCRNFLPFPLSSRVNFCGLSMCAGAVIVSLFPPPPFFFPCQLVAVFVAYRYRLQKDPEVDPYLLLGGGARVTWQATHLSPSSLHIFWHSPHSTTYTHTCTLTPKPFHILALVCSVSCPFLPCWSLFIQSAISFFLLLSLWTLWWLIYGIYD